MHSSLIHHLTLMCKQKLPHSCNTIPFLPDCILTLILYSHKINVRRLGETQWAPSCINTLVMWCAWFYSIHTHFTWEPYSKHEEDKVEEGRNFEENKEARYVVSEKETSREAFPITQIYLQPSHPFVFLVTSTEMEKHPLRAIVPLYTQLREEFKGTAVKTSCSLL